MGLSVQAQLRWSLRATRVLRLGSIFVFLLSLVALSSTESFTSPYGWMVHAKHDEATDRVRVSSHFCLFRTGRPLKRFAARLEWTSRAQFRLATVVPSCTQSCTAASGSIPRAEIATVRVQAPHSDGYWLEFFLCPPRVDWGLHAYFRTNTDPTRWVLKPFCTRRGALSEQAIFLREAAIAMKTAVSIVLHSHASLVALLSLRAVISVLTRFAITLSRNFCSRQHSGIFKGWMLVLLPTRRTKTLMVLLLLCVETFAMDPSAAAPSPTSDLACSVVAAASAAASATMGKRIRQASTEAPLVEGNRAIPDHVCMAGLLCGLVGLLLCDFALRVVV